MDQTDLEDHELWRSDLGDYIRQEADDMVSIETVRQELACISGSLAAAICQEREER